MDATSILISHAANESYLAHAWKELICNAFNGIDRESVFFSSQLGAFNAHETFVQQIFQKMREATSILSLQTPTSTNRAWIIFEGGMAWADKGKSLYPIIYESGDVEKCESIFGKLQNPMNGLQQYKGTEPAQALTVLGLIQRDIVNKLKGSDSTDRIPLLDPVNLAAALSEYNKTIEKNRFNWINRTRLFHKRIELRFTHDEHVELLASGKIPQTVRVDGDPSSLAVFGVTRARKWADFLAHLEKLHLPWPGSADRWARGLGRFLQMSQSDRLLDGPEGVPLYFDPFAACSYRPSILSCVEEEGQTVYTISFTLLPAELTDRPSGKIGVILHYLDFARMMRWGVLENRDFLELFRQPAKPDEEEVKINDEFIGKILSIRTEFWNRGLKRDSLEQAVPVEFADEVRQLLDEYKGAMSVIDPPKNQGETPNPMPDLKISKHIYEIVFGSISDSIRSWLNR